MVGLAKAMGIRSRNLTSWKLLREGTSVDSQQGKKGRRKEGNGEVRRLPEAPLCAHPTPAHCRVESFESNPECLLTCDWQVSSQSGHLPSLALPWRLYHHFPLIF